MRANIINYVYFATTSASSGVVTLVGESILFQGLILLIIYIHNPHALFQFPLFSA